MSARLSVEPIGAIAGGRQRIRDLPACLRQLPGVERPDVGQLVDGGEQDARPLPRRLQPLQPLDDPAEAVDELGEATGEGDLVAVDVVERQGEPNSAQIVFVHRRAEEDPVEPGPPGVLGRAFEVVSPARVGVEAPANPRARNPVAHPLERLVVEAETDANRRHRRQVEYLRGGET